MGSVEDSDKNHVAEARLAAIQQWRQQRQQRLATAGASDILPLKPQRVYQELREVLPRNTIVTIDAGAAASHAYNLLDFYEPRTFITPATSDVSGRGSRRRWAPNWHARIGQWCVSAVMAAFS